MREMTGADVCPPVLVLAVICTPPPVAGVAANPVQISRDVVLSLGPERPTIA
jgi:hypothetical protein